MGCTSRRRFQRQPDGRGNLVITDFTWPPRTQLIQEPVNSSLRKAAPPFAHCVRIDIQVCADLFVLKPLCREQHNPSPTRQTLRRAATPSQSLKLASFRATQFNRNRSFAHGSSSESGCMIQ
jgi:hypothetical protein